MQMQMQPSHQSIITTAPRATPTPSSAGGGQFMATNCPPGLEHLAAVQGVYVKQLMEMIEMFAGIETANRYEVMDSYGQRIFFAAETTDPCTVMCLGVSRPFTIQLLNFYGAPVLTLTRECSCLLACGCLMCGGNTVKVEHISGELLGTATQICGCCTPQFELRDAAGQLAFLIHGPACGDCCRVCTMGPCCTADFRIVLADNVTEIGVIQKKVGLQEMVSDATTFGVSFPIQLEPKLKALILAAVFVIDFGYFESSPQSGHHHHHY